MGQPITGAARSWPARAQAARLSMLPAWPAAAPAGPEAAQHGFTAGKRWLGSWQAQCWSCLQKRRQRGCWLVRGTARRGTAPLPAAAAGTASLPWPQGWQRTGRAPAGQMLSNGAGLAPSRQGRPPPVGPGWRAAVRRQGWQPASPAPPPAGAAPAAPDQAPMAAPPAPPSLTGGSSSCAARRRRRRRRRHARRCLRCPLS